MADLSLRTQPRGGDVVARPRDRAAGTFAGAACVAARTSSNTGEAWIRIGVDDGRLIVDVRDDGVGGASATTGGIGLAGLGDRIAALDGELTISSLPAKRTTLHAEIPLR